MTSAQALARLATLSEDAGTNYYERIQLADQLMQDRNWLATNFKSDDYAAAEMLETKYFHDLSGSMTVWMLLHIYRKFPNQADWKAQKYHLRTLYAMCKPPANTSPTVKRTIKVADYEKVEQQVKETKFQLQQKTKALEVRESELEILKKKVTRLERENAELHGRVNELERILSKKLAS